ncbi:ABC transporter substrate-binding protein [Xylanibacillus composti]|uniref:Cobalamin-binding protein n=1 Tax=Xylanibacillus composti TaxID=1572762 RepID=A0A8J4H7E4_9BACL|nr:ABC transporter substrate-binding protein [Xylanibacillus composti]MDT9726877.1 ABC transporter substrate-binding protein [Xylanibacillus composti]GIQ71351.1 cobalamin-binding protein [Xylanibacillus composti]
MKALSFLPASTHIIQELGLEDYLYGVTFECPSDKPKVVRSYLEGQSYTSSELNRIVSEHARLDQPLYYLDMDLLREIRPDVIFTQHVCNVCQIGTSYVERAVHQLDKQPKLVPLVPRQLRDVLDNMLTISKELAHEPFGHALVESCNARIDRIASTLRAHKRQPRRVMVMEWIEPIFNCGHWIPEQISLAGGWDPLSAPEGYSSPTAWERVKDADPEVIVIAPCGFDVKRTAQEAEKLYELDGWEQLTAVRHHEVYAADGQFFTQPSTSLIDGTELLAGLFHPDLFQIPDALADLVLPLAKARVAEGS